MSQNHPETPAEQALKRAGLVPSRPGGYPVSSTDDLKRVADFFQAAADFWECAPWEVLSSEEVLRVEGLGPAPVHLSVWGGEENEVPGLLVSASEFRPGPPQADRVSCHFVAAEQAGEDLLVEIQAQGLGLADPDAVPVAFRRDAAGLATPADLSSLVRCMQVVQAFLKAGLEELESVERRALTLPDRGRVLVTWKEVDPFASLSSSRLPIQAPAPPQAEASNAPAPFRHAPRPGRNEPCWCGSGQKYKKCHLDEDRNKDSEALRREGFGLNPPG